MVARIPLELMGETYNDWLPEPTAIVEFERAIACMLDENAVQIAKAFLCQMSEICGT